uniref:Keratinocyte proline-rich protein-like isoform X3 n=1 Tax=Rhizophora mucronata TaxID=61149 RepID=A0A2P2M851_RHIMU
MLQVTTMVIKVDLGCEKCRKKIKKVLCKIPQIKNQIYDEKSNTVTITVGCGCPEKVKEKIRCKAGDIILGIEIKPPETSKEPKKKPEDKKPTEKPELQKKPKTSTTQQTDDNTGDGKQPENRKAWKEPATHNPPWLVNPQPMPWECYKWGPRYWDPCMPPPWYGSGGCSRIYVRRCSDYVCEENPTAPCRIM